MRHARLIAIAITIVFPVLAVATATPAMAGFGAIAYDEATGKYGASWNEPTQARANQRALKQCGAKCQVHPVEPAGCGALAKSEKKGDKAWGGADRETLEEARQEAVAHCQSHTSEGSCAVRVSGCNK